MAGVAGPAQHPELTIRSTSLGHGVDVLGGEVISSVRCPLVSRAPGPGGSFVLSHPCGSTPALSPCSGALGGSGACLVHVQLPGVAGAPVQPGGDKGATMDGADAWCASHAHLQWWVVEESNLASDVYLATKGTGVRGVSSSAWTTHRARAWASRLCSAGWWRGEYWSRSPGLSWSEIPKHPVFTQDMAKPLCLAMRYRGFNKAMITHFWTVQVTRLQAIRPPVPA